MGENHDPTGLVYLNNRYHHPQTQSFISVDPLVTTTHQPYTYATSNPTTRSDPSGLCDFVGEGLGCHGARHWTSDKTQRGMLRLSSTRLEMR